MSVLTNKVGVSITENSIQLVEIFSKDNKLFLENVDEEYFEESLYEDTKEAKFIHILQNAFNEIVLRNPLKSSNISIALPPSYFKTFEIPADKNLTKNDLNDYISWEITKLYPNENTDSLVTQKIILDTPTFQSYKRVLVYSINENILRRIHKFCVRNNLSLKQIDNAHIAGSMLNIDKDTILSIYVETKDISLILFSNKNVIYQAQKQFSLISQIPELINSVIEDVKERDLLSTPIDSLYLDGLSITKELKNSIVSSTNLQIKDCLPFSQLEVNQNLNENSYVRETSSKFTSATSIALRIEL